MGDYTEKEANKLAKAVERVLRFNGPTFTTSDYSTNIEAINHVNKALEVMKRPYRLGYADGAAFTADQDEFPFVKRVVIVKPE